jgi:hypothetical protein
MGIKRWSAMNNIFEKTKLGKNSFRSAIITAIIECVINIVVLILESLVGDAIVQWLNGNGFSLAGFINWIVTYPLLSSIVFFLLFLAGLMYADWKKYGNEKVVPSMNTTSNEQSIGDDGIGFQNSTFDKPATIDKSKVADFSRAEIKDSNIYVSGTEDKKKDNQLFAQSEIERLMNNVVSSATYFANDFFPDGEQNREERYISAHEANKAFWEYYKDNRRYVSNRTSSELDKLKTFLKNKMESINILYGADDHLEIDKHAEELREKSLAMREKILDSFRESSQPKSGEDYVSYPGLKLLEDTNGVNLDEYFQLDTTMVRLWVIVSNRNKYVYDCQVVLDKFEYCDYQQGSTWGRAYSGFDRKAMKWDVGYLPNDGKIELECEANKLLEIARATRKHPDINMKLSHLDGYSTRVYNLDGKYRATFRIDGKIFVGNIKKPIRALKYRVTFKYEQLPLLKIIEIERIGK